MQNDETFLINITSKTKTIFFIIIFFVFISSSVILMIKGMNYAQHYIGNTYYNHTIHKENEIKSYVYRVYFVEVSIIMLFLAIAFLTLSWLFKSKAAKGIFAIILLLGLVPFTVTFILAFVWLISFFLNILSVITINIWSYIVGIINDKHTYSLLCILVFVSFIILVFSVYFKNNDTR